ncbi:ComEA family DNA-binding protein [Agromyces sp. NPDC058104]|uniref:ComEA family DNA-binding protein n=1 Tax=Agromyces sp. NPDC058104 TaxID=3346342 RepID=UPI0036DD23CF
MPPPDPPDPLAALDPSARRASARVRLGVGAAVALFIAAVAVAAMLSFTSAGGGAQPSISFADSGGGGAAGADAATPAAASPSVVLVHVLGAVAEPGLVELDDGARVVDAIAAAGGLAADADPAGVNLARAVADGEQLVVPVVGAPPAEGAGAGAVVGAPSDGKVHLNTADVAELDTLPRIGPALAQRIIDWREANGPFTSTEQLLDVAGIGDAVYSGLADLVAL